MENDTKKIMKAFRLSPASVQTLAELAKKERITETAVLEQLIKKASMGDEKGSGQEFLAAFDGKYGNDMTGILLSSRQAERYMYILIEMVNSLIQNTVSGSSEYFMGTHRYELLQAKQNKDEKLAAELEEFPSKSYKGAVEEAQKFFSYVKQRKDNAVPGAG